MERGFSLSEVLVSLLLITSISLALLKQQWQVTRMVYQTQEQAKAWLQAVNERERGFGLVELLIALALTMGLMTLLIQQYLQVKQQFQQVQISINQASRLQLIEHFIRRSIRQAGFTPCLPLNHLITLDQRSSHSLQTIVLNQEDPSKLEWYGMQDQVRQVTTIKGLHQLYIAEKSGVSLQSPLIISDCQHAEVHTAFQVLPLRDGLLVTLQQPLAFTYHSPIYLGEWMEASIFVKPNPFGQSALYYHHRHSEELIPGVKTMTYHLDQTHRHLLVHLDWDVAQGSGVAMDIRVRNS